MSRTTKFAPNISGLAAAMSTNDSATMTTHSFGSYGSNDISNASSTQSTLAVFGIQSSLYFTQVFGMQARVLVPSDPKFAQIGLGLDFRF